MLTKIIGAVAISMIAYSAYTKMDGGPAKTSLSGSALVVENQRYKFDYALAGPSSLGGVLIATGRQRGVSQGGVEMALHYFDESSAAEFVRTQQPGHCSAEFYNEHALHKLLIPATPAVREMLADLDFSDHEDTASWRRFTLNGRCVNYAKSITIDDHPAAGPSNLFDNCTTMVVTDISVQDKPIQGL
ncbi:hypothetical protein [Methylocystis echinoides]|uniref:Uncharacterized protein n=1 Tax=Methylocystis echinoides TaxID=29468 RepID=A0A9W6LQJ9_9HYPH|nr:hypothetical protein [Methylocystis echinoides]GLI91446.1 hypothetical protein LMG27198_04380 [Methylocystis echinoides]